MKLRYLLAAVVAWLWVIPGPAADPASLQPAVPSSSVQHSLKEGLDAYRQGQFRRALVILQPFAEGGDAQAQFALAMMYSSGSGVELDEYQAAHWFELAATQDHRDAAYFLAQLYEQGWGATRSPTLALRWYQRCADLADLRCRTRLAQFSGEGLGLTPAKVQVIATEATIISPSVPHPPASVALGPKAAEPVVSGSGATEPAALGPKIAESVASGPKAAEPVTPNPKTAEPVAPGLKAAELVALGPKTAELAPPFPVAINVEPRESVPSPAVVAERSDAKPVASPVTLVLPPTSPAIESNEPAPVVAAELLGEDWIRTQKPNNYTLQILTSPLERDIRTFVRKHDLKGDFAMVPELRQGRIWYNLLYGSYKTASIANKARTTLPPEAVKNGAWGRRFRDLLRIAPPQEKLLPAQDKPIQ
ncbi:conserved exported hypothetical protein [Gammaproteobacteria bacterium]